MDPEARHEILAKALADLMSGELDLKAFFWIENKLGYKAEAPPPWLWTRPPMPEELRLMRVKIELPPEPEFFGPPAPKPERKPGLAAARDEPLARSPEWVMPDGPAYHVQPLEIWKRQIRRRRETQAVREMGGWR